MFEKYAIDSEEMIKITIWFVCVFHCSYIQTDFHLSYLRKSQTNFNSKENYLSTKSKEKVNPEIVNAYFVIAITKYIVLTVINPLVPKYTVECTIRKQLYSIQLPAWGSQIENRVRIRVEFKGCRDWRVSYMLHWAFNFQNNFSQVTNSSINNNLGLRFWMKT